MKIFTLYFLAPFFVFDFSIAATDFCVNRRLIIELEKSQTKQLKAFFESQSDLPYSFNEKDGTNGISIFELSYRRKKRRDNFPEPLSYDLFKKVVERLSNQFELFKIKKLSAEFVPGQCL